MPDHRNRIGIAGEEHALAHYLRLDFLVVERNARTRWGELDLIVVDATTLVFCEVRTRVHGRGDPLESFGPRKVRQVRRMAANWLSTNKGPEAPRRPILRLDAAADLVTPDGELVELQVLEGAL